MKYFLAAAALLLPLFTASSQPAPKQQKETRSATGAAAKLPTAAEVDTALKRNFGYDPAITWKILHISASDAPGIADALVLLNNRDYVHFYVLPSVQRAIQGEMIPFGPHPFREERKKLQAADGPARGAKNPAISIIEFSDLECPYCKDAQPTIDRLTADFPQARFVFQNFPLPIHPWAMKAALYADCASRENPAAFWKFVDSTFQNQGSIAPAIADDKLKELVTGAGLDASKISACSGLPSTAERVKKSIALGRSVGVQGTPTVFINGRALPGLGGLDYDKLKSLVQFEIAHAKSE